MEVGTLPSLQAAQWGVCVLGSGRTVCPKVGDGGVGGRLAGSGGTREPGTVTTAHCSIEVMRSRRLVFVSEERAGQVPKALKAGLWKVTVVTLLSFPFLPRLYQCQSCLRCSAQVDNVRDKGCVSGVWVTLAHRAEG